MTDITLSDELAKRLEALARREKRTIDEVMASLLDEHVSLTKSQSVGQTPNWDLIIGIGDKNVTDMSTTVRETLKKYFQEKYGNTD